MLDVIIIGAGIVGCSIARELSKYNLKICVLEKTADLAAGASKANSGIVHAGHDAKPGSLKALLNVKGNSMFERLSEELDFPFRRNGSLVLCFDERGLMELNSLKERGIKNGVQGLQILNREQALLLEPNLSEKVQYALYAPTGGIVCPYEMTAAMAENAFLNGVTFKFNCEVTGIEKREEQFIVFTNNGSFAASLVINAAGVFADKINNMVSKNKITIIPRKGEYCLFDRTAGNIVSRTIFQLPTKLGKGVLVTPTVDGNLLIGPNASDTADKEDVTTTAEGINDILSKAQLSLRRVPVRQVITSFAGLRAHIVTDDFIIGETEDVDNFINAAGIESPGLTSAPAIAEMVKNIVVKKLSPAVNPNFNPVRKGIPKFREMSNEERRQIIAADPSYGRVICRCETVTEGEIVNSIRRTLGARTLDGVKRRCRAGMGRCQSGFCSAKIVEILSRELKIAAEEVTKFGGSSNILIGKNKEI